MAQKQLHLFRVTQAFFKREVLMTRPITLVFQWMEGFFMIAFWHFVAQFVQHSTLPAPQSTDYFTHSLIGLAMLQYAWRGFSAFGGRIRSEQASGSFESLWNTGTPLLVALALASVWDFLRASVFALLVLLTGKFLFDANLSIVQIFVMVGVGLTASLAMAGLGLIFASLNIASGRGDLFKPVLNSAFPFLCGAFFPVTLLPSWLQTVSWFIPLTHLLHIARAPLGTQNKELLRNSWFSLWVIMLCFCVIGYLSLRWAIHRARINGRLSAI